MTAIRFLVIFLSEIKILTKRNQGLKVILKENKLLSHDHFYFLENFKCNYCHVSSL